MVFEKLKETLMKRIEENSVKSELTYVDKEGVEQTELVYLKRGKGKLGDWHQSYLPVKEDGKWNIPNALFGGTKNLLKLLFYLAVAGFFFLAIREAYGNYNALVNLPCVRSCLNVVNITG